MNKEPPVHSFINHLVKALFLQGFVLNKHWHKKYETFYSPEIYKILCLSVVLPKDICVILFTSSENSSYLNLRFLNLLKAVIRTFSFWRKMFLNLLPVLLTDFLSIFKSFKWFYFTLKTSNRSTFLNLSFILMFSSQHVILVGSQWNCWTIVH